MAGQKIGEMLESIEPEVAYFSDHGVGRRVLMTVELPGMSCRRPDWSATPPADHCG